MLLYLTSKTVKQLQKTYSSIIHTPKSGVFHTCLPLHITFLPFQSYLNKFYDDSIYSIMLMISSPPYPGTDFN